MSTQKVLLGVCAGLLLGLLLLVAYAERGYAARVLYLGTGTPPEGSRLQVYDGRAYLAMPRTTCDVPFTLGSVGLTEGRAVVRPVHATRHLHNVVDIFVDDRGTLWALDDGVVHKMENCPVMMAKPRVLAIEPVSGNWFDKPERTCVREEQTRIRIRGRDGREEIRIRGRRWYGVRGGLGRGGGEGSPSATAPEGRAGATAGRPPLGADGPRPRQRHYSLLYVPLESGALLRGYVLPPRRRPWAGPRGGPQAPGHEAPDDSAGDGARLPTRRFSRRLYLGYEHCFPPQQFRSFGRRCGGEGSGGGGSKRRRRLGSYFAPGTTAPQVTSCPPPPTCCPSTPSVHRV